MQVHQALGVERRGIRVVRIHAHDRAHRILVVHRQRFHVGLRPVRVALDERRHVSFFAGRRTARAFQRLLDCVVCGLLAIRIDVLIDVRSERKRDAPPRHRRRGIEFGRTAKRAHRLFVVERVYERQPLVEKLLRVLAARLDGVMHAGHAFDQRHRPIVGRGRVIVLLRRAAGQGDDQGQLGKGRQRHACFSSMVFSAPSPLRHPICMTS